MKKLLSVDQVRQWDAATISGEPIDSIDLMERAAKACVVWLFRNGFAHRSFTVVCGVGNNGGDGLAIARLLARASCKVQAVVIVGDTQRASADFTENVRRLRSLDLEVPVVTDFTTVQTIDVCIDALFGTGLDRKPEGGFQAAIESINAKSCTIVSIDVPSGLPGNPTAFEPVSMVDADHTLTFQQWKEGLFHPKPLANLKRDCCVHVLDIGLLDGFRSSVDCTTFTFDRNDAAARISDRKRFSHKGSFGAAFIAAGSGSMPGAAILSVNAALHSGCGLVFAHVPASVCQMVQQSAPEAMTAADAHPSALSHPSIPEKVTAMACGPGIGTGDEQRSFLLALLDDPRPLVLDADALNLASIHPLILQKIKSHRNSVLTPHPAEFDRLFGKHEGHLQRLNTAKRQAADLNAVIHLKGAYSVTVTPDGKTIYHTTGSAAMAVGGSGDALTGLIAGVWASGYSREDAVLLGVALHGTAGECFEMEFGRMGLTAGELIERVPQAWKILKDAR